MFHSFKSTGSLGLNLKQDLDNYIINNVPAKELHSLLLPEGGALHRQHLALFLNAKKSVCRGKDSGAPVVNKAICLILCKST